MTEYTFEITFTSKGKKYTATSVVEYNKKFGLADFTEILFVALKYVFSRHPTANNINWKLI